MEPPYLTVAALSVYLSLSESTIRGLMKGPDPLPSFTVGRSRRFYRPAVDTWMARRAGASQAVDTVLDELRAGRRKDHADFQIRPPAAYSGQARSASTNVSGWPHGEPPTSKYAKRRPA